MFNGGGGGRGFSGGRGRGRGGRTYNPQQGQNNGGAPAEHSVYRPCRFYAKGNCTNNNCGFQHFIKPMIVLQPHKANNNALNPVMALNVIDGGADAAPRILTGSVDNAIHVWSLASQNPEVETSIPVTGQVTDIEVFGDQVMYALNEPIAPEVPDLTVGVVHLLNKQTMTTIPLKRSEDMPYSDPFGHIRSFTMKMINDVPYVITAGGDGVIRTWRYDGAQSKFELVTSLEGHFRPVTCMLLLDTYLWSGSIDQTIRVWDMNTGKCVGMLCAPTGHSAAVTCIVAVPPSGTSADTFVISASLNGELKRWTTGGEGAGATQATGVTVTALNVFQHQAGQQMLFIGLESGTFAVRSCDQNLQLLFTIDALTFNTKHIRNILSFRGCFVVTGGDDGQVILWQIENLPTPGGR